MKTEQFQLHADIEQRHWWFRGRRRIMRRLVDRALPGRTGCGGAPQVIDGDGGTSLPDRLQTCPTDEAPLVIDVGCGTGANIAALAGDYRCVGIDTSAEAIQRAARRFPAVDFRQGFAPQDLDDCFARADLVMLMDVLEHVPDDFDLLSRLLSAARPGAQFLLTVPADLDLWSEHDESFGHWRRYDAARFARLWRGLPVRVRLLSHYNARLFPLVKWIRKRNRRRGRAQGTAGTDFAIPSAPINRALEHTFAGEVGPLLRAFDRPSHSPYRQGVSLVAILERQPGHIDIQGKPADAAADYFDPQAGELIGAA